MSNDCAESVECDNAFHYDSSTGKWELVKLLVETEPNTNVDGDCESENSEAGSELLVMEDEPKVISTMAFLNQLVTNIITSVAETFSEYGTTLFN
jgi:hypothetical protein